MSRRKRSLHWRRDEYIPPDIESSVQLLQVIRIGIATYGQIMLVVHPESVEIPYWTIQTPDLTQTVKPHHMRLLIERKLIDLRDMNPKEFLAQHALGTLKGIEVIIGITNNNQLGLNL